MTTESPVFIETSKTMALTSLSRELTKQLAIEGESNKEAIARNPSVIGRFLKRGIPEKTTSHPVDQAFEKLQYADEVIRKSIVDSSIFSFRPGLELYLFPDGQPNVAPFITNDGIYFFVPSEGGGRYIDKNPDGSRIDSTAIPPTRDALLDLWNSNRNERQPWLRNGIVRLAQTKKSDLISYSIDEIRQNVI